MTDNFDTLQLFGRHLPDKDVSDDGTGVKVATELPGLYQVGFKVGDTFHVIGTFKAGEIVAAKRKLAEQSKAEQASSSSSSTPSDATQ